MLKRESFIPQDAVKYYDQDGVLVYLYESQGRPAAVGFSGKQIKPRLYHYYQDSETRLQRVDQWITAQRKNIDAKLERKARKTTEKRAFLESLKPGTILCGSWGYEQTNIDFYIVLEVQGVTVTLQELGHIQSDYQSHGMACEVMPDLDRRGQTIKRRVASDYIKINESQWLAAWDGKKKYCSWYA